jgi:hypothetical protein
MQGMSEIGKSLTAVFDFAWDRFTTRLEGLSDEEYFWQPVPVCWSLRRDAEGNWVLDGEGGGGPPPDPLPVTTIAWRIGHIGELVLRGFTDRFFSGGTDDVPSALPSSANEAREFLGAQYRRWRAGMTSAEDDLWWAQLGPDWGPYSEANGIDLAMHVLDELVHHAAEVGLLRDLYLYRDALGHG